MIELLKVNFSLCLLLLKRFEKVDDPYVIQRLYGVIFGAITKNDNIKESELKELAEYIYDTIFDKELNYPDILVRDYSKLVIEYFLFKFPKYKTNIDESKITPPYKSNPIPVVEKTQKEYDSGLYHIAHSMAPEGLEDMMYGDFGRYVFDSALSDFSNVNSIKVYNYAMEFIENILGYKNDLFGEYDKSMNYNSTDRVERIGKKYQWIAMYNILARISDHYELSNRWNEGDGGNKFEGAWNPYVRDFDPTLNNNFLNNPDVPSFAKKEQKGITFIDRDASRQDIEKWVNDEEDEFFYTNSEILLSDEIGNEWVALNYYNIIKNTDNDLESTYKNREGLQNKWVMAQSYFIKKNEFELVKDDLVSKNFMSKPYPESNQNTYWLFNREFGWSSGYKQLTNDDWLEYETQTGEFEVMKYPDLSGIIFKSEDEQSVGSSKVKYKEYEKPILKVLARIMRTSNRFLWEEEYDASQSKAISYDIPCGFLIDDLELEQREYDGYYYDKSGELVAFYDRTNQDLDSPYKLLILKKCLDEFLEKNELSIFWKCLGEKQIVIKKMRDQEWSEWRGLLTLTDNGVDGEIRKFDKTD